MSVAFNKFNSFVAAAANKVHNLGSDSLKVALSNTAPTAANTKLSDITEITYTNLSTRAITTLSSAQTSGLYSLILQDLVLTASGGTVGPFRYVIIYNDSATNKELIGWYDFGSSFTMNPSDTTTCDFDGVNGLLQLQ